MDEQSARLAASNLGIPYLSTLSCLESTLANTAGQNLACPSFRKNTP
jgi:hypothetical protein